MVFALQALSRLTWRTLNTAMKSSFNPHIFSSVSRAISSTDSINEQMGLLGNAAKRASDLRFRCAEFIKRCEESSNDGSVDLSIGQDVAEIKLNNPKKRNAFSGQMFLDLEKVVTQLESWQDGKAAIIYGAENAFCSGGDLDFVSQQINTDELGRQMSLFMSDTTDRLARLPFVTVAMVRGPAQGGGAELTTACDYRVFTRSADVRFVQAKLGITTGFGGASRLARIIGPTRALQILCSTASINVSNARMLRFCELICKDGEGLDITKAWLSDNFLKVPADIIRSYKRIACEGPLKSLSESYDLETELFSATWGNERHVQAVEEYLSNAAKSNQPDRAKSETGP